MAWRADFPPAASHRPVLYWRPLSSAGATMALPQPPRQPAPHQRAAAHATHTEVGAGWLPLQSCRDSDGRLTSAAAGGGDGTSGVTTPPAFATPSSCLQFPVELGQLALPIFRHPWSQQPSAADDDSAEVLLFPRGAVECQDLSWGNQHGDGGFLGWQPANTSAKPKALVLRMGESGGTGAAGSQCERDGRAEAAAAVAATVPNTGSKAAAKKKRRRADASDTSISQGGADEPAGSTSRHVYSSLKYSREDEEYVPRQRGWNSSSSSSEGSSDDEATGSTAARAAPAAPARRRRTAADWQAEMDRAIASRGAWRRGGGGGGGGGSSGDEEGWRSEGAASGSDDDEQPAAGGRPFPVCARRCWLKFTCVARVLVTKKSGETTCWAADAVGEAIAPPDDGVCVVEADKGNTWMFHLLRQLATLHQAGWIELSASLRFASRTLALYAVRFD
jgi:hypothetical protein